MCSAAVLLTGIIILALPITVIGTNFSRVLRQVQTEKLIDELDGANRNPDGSVQRAEIEAIIAHIHSASAEHGLTVHLPVDAAELLAKYDADGSGKLEQGELDALKRDILLQSLTGDKKAAPHAEAAKRKHHEEVAQAAQNAADDAGAAAAQAAQAQAQAAGPATSSAAHGRNTISGAFSAATDGGAAAPAAAAEGVRVGAGVSPASLAFANEVNNALAQIEGNVNAKLSAIEGLLQRLAERPAAAGAAAAGAVSFDGTDQEHSAAAAIQARVRGAQSRQGQEQQQPKAPVVEDRDPGEIVVDRYGGDMYERLANEATLYGDAAKAEAAEAAGASAAGAAAAAAGGGGGGGEGAAAAASPSAASQASAMVAPQDADNAPEGRGTVVASRFDDHSMPRGSFYDPNKRDYYQSAGGGIES